MERLTRLAQRPSRIALGLMSGMSRDGLDMALVRIDEGRVEALAITTRSYEPAMQDRLGAAEAAKMAELCDLERDLTECWAGWIEEFLADRPVDQAPPYVIGSHGQTVYHRPRAQDLPAATLQIGDGDLLAQRLDTAVVSDFRRRDIAAGGEGAPLIPMADWLLYREAGRTIACHNLGSISNVTVVPPDFDGLRAFDTGPANVLIDAFARRAEAGDIDRDGALSARGSVDDDLLLWLYMQRAEWLAWPPPKSAGYGTFGRDLANAAVQAHPHLGVEDLVRTAVEFTAQTIRDAYENFVLPFHPDLDLVRFSGGGCLNPTLMDAIRAKLERAGLEVSVLPPDWVAGKEAIGFALLADRTVRGLAGNHPGATGATEPVVLGKISL